MINKKKISTPAIVGVISFLFLLGCTQQQFQSVVTITDTSTSQVSQTSMPVNTFTPTPTAIFTPTPTITQQPGATYTPTYSVSPNSLFLSDMSPYNNPRNVEGGLALDRVFWQHEIWIDGKYYSKGLGMHAPLSGVGFVSYKAPMGYTKFASLAGLAWQDDNPGCEPAGDARFRVYVNNELEFGSDIVHFGPPLVIQIAVKEGDILRLEVDRGEDDYECDHSTWAEARFEP